MARMAGAVWLGEHGKNRMREYDGVVYHTIVGRAPAHAATFSTRGDGLIYQSRNTIYQSAACFEGNPRLITIENEDMGPYFDDWPAPDEAPPLTELQVVANGKILAFAHEEHGIPLQLMPNSRSTSRGLGWHRQGIDGNFGPYRYPGRAAGGERWSTSFGKVCPTDPRIDQRGDILDVAITIVRGGDVPSVPDEPSFDDWETDMFLSRKGSSGYVLVTDTWAPIDLSKRSFDELVKYKVPVRTLSNLSLQILDDVLPPAPAYSIANDVMGYANPEDGQDAWARIKETQAGVKELLARPS